MNTWGLLVLAALLAGCPYVTKGEYDEHWDVDGDGWGIGEDCAPDDPDVHPYAGDRRGDGCDADCGAEPDGDGDDWPDDADCDPANAFVYPCSPAEAAGDGIDSDCDGLDTVRTTPCSGQDPDWPDARLFSESDCPVLAG